MKLDGSIEVIALSASKFVSINQSGTNMVLTGTQGIPGAAYSLWTSTDVTLPLGSWTSLLTNQFGPAGDFSFSLPVDPRTPHQFFLLRTP